MALPRAAASRVDSWFGSDAVDKRTTTFAGTPRPTLSALPRKRRYPNRMHYCAYCATPPTSDSQYQCARSGIDYILHWSARIRGAVRRLRRTALGDTASVLVFIVLVFKREAPVRVHAVLPLAHSASRTRARLATRSSARSGQKLATLTGFAKHLLEEEPSHRAQRRIPIVHRRTGDLSLRLRRRRPRGARSLGAAPEGAVRRDGPREGVIHVVHRPHEGDPGAATQRSHPGSGLHAHDPIPALDWAFYSPSEHPP